MSKQKSTRPKPAPKIVRALRYMSQVKTMPPSLSWNTVTHYCANTDKPLREHLILMKKNKMLNYKKVEMLTYKLLFPIETIEDL